MLAMKLFEIKLTTRGNKAHVEQGRKPLKKTNFTVSK